VCRTLQGSNDTPPFLNRQLDVQQDHLSYSMVIYVVQLIYLPQVETCIYFS
jgi:hypothetical protein